MKKNLNPGLVNHTLNSSVLETGSEAVGKPKAGGDKIEQEGHVPELGHIGHVALAWESRIKGTSRTIVAGLLELRN